MFIVSMAALRSPIMVQGKLKTAWKRITGGQEPPPAQNAIDTTLAWGDVLMLVTTQTVRCTPHAEQAAPCGMSSF